MLGGQQGEMPLVRLASLAVGDAAAEDLQVGVFTALPHAPFIDGLLGGDFLKHFILRLDYAQSRLQLIPQDTPNTPSRLATSPPAAVLSTMPGGGRRQPYTGPGHAQPYRASHTPPRYRCQLHYADARNGSACRAASDPA